MIFNINNIIKSVEINNIEDFYFLKKFYLTK